MMDTRIEDIIHRLREMHGEPRCELKFRNPLELTVATVLSAQCTDERVNRVTDRLFEKYTTVDDYLNVPLKELEDDIRPTGFYRNKAKAIKNIAREIIERFHGEIPKDIDTFATVKGIGRKSANMIVGLAYNVPAIIVDTHVIRVSGRIGFTKEEDPVEIELDLKKIIPVDIWKDFSLLLILHGRYICKAKRPECERCLLDLYCAYFQKSIRM